MTEDRTTRLEAALAKRFGERVAVDPSLEGLEALATMAERGSHRAFRPDPVDDGLLEMLAAVALASPTKSDLQQRDIVVIRDPDMRARIDALLTGQSWIAGAPALLVFCGNNRRQRQIHDWRARDFANDHLDAFFNAAVDAGIALAAFVTAAEATGLGCCPISAIRNEAEEVSTLLGLPDHVFPVSGLGVGWPHYPSSRISMRLPLRTTLHRDRFNETGLRDAVDDYDRRRAEAAPYATQRFVDRYGAQDDYGWSEDKARQYSAPERADFGAFVRRKGFTVE